MWNNKTIEWKFSTERFEAENKNKELYKKWIKELIQQFVFTDK